MMMMLVSVLCAWFAFALPAYATYKALARSEPLDTLSAYWAVIGVFIAFEQSLGVFLSWLPFYWELRTIFLLYVSLPQTQGSDYVYKNLLEPWFSRNEADFDATLASAQSNAITFCRARIAALLDLLWNFLNKSPVSDQSAPTHPIDHLKGLWNSYGPSVAAALAPKDTHDHRSAN